MKDFASIDPRDPTDGRAAVKNIAEQDNFVGMYLNSASSGLFAKVFTMEPRTYGLAIGCNFQ